MMEAEDGAQSLDDLSFEGAYARLEEVLSRLQMGNMTLDDSLAAYEEGMALAAHCQTLLDAAELRVEALERVTDAADGDDDDEPPF
ncbi:MAG TPA: exodeoxyribonuclease VII small subunit [Thermomicrobiales bacterium]|jgi:exodeoxyribonuclease VII small subunit